MSDKVSFLVCPAELRQQILRLLLPSDIRAAGEAPRTAPLRPLILTCKTFQRDIQKLLNSWWPVYHFERPNMITAGRWRSDEPHIRDISLRFFADVDLNLTHNLAPSGANGAVDAEPWKQCLSDLPRAAVRSVVVDLTAAPAWMTHLRPDWVRATLLDSRNRSLLMGCDDDIVELVRRLCELYGPEVEVDLGGEVFGRVKGPVLDIVRRARGEAGREDVEFVGTWLKGPREVPWRLSLVNLCRCWRMELSGAEAEARYGEARMSQIRSEARRAGLTAPDLDLKALGPVCWSRNSGTAYYVNAMEDEKRTRSELVCMLSFAVAVRTLGTSYGTTMDFAPAVRERRWLLHCVAKDLRLASKSVGDAGEKFVRVSRGAEPGPKAEAAADGTGVLEGGGNEKYQVRGDEDYQLSRWVEDMQVQGDEDQQW